MYHPISFAKMSFYITAIIFTLFPVLAISQSCTMQDDVCEFKLVVKYHLTMVHDKTLMKPFKGNLYPYNVDNMTAANSMSSDKVISMDGYEESTLIIAANGTVPGPPIEVYKGQTVIIEVENHLYSESITIHWHGLHQRHTPHMDGVPFVTQCPISSGQSFTYKFNITQTGTYWYHSHMGTQQTMGLYGAFIIRERKKQEIEDHTMVISDYNHLWDSDKSFLKKTSGMYEHGKLLRFTTALDGGLFSPFRFHSGLVNGRGRFYNESGHHNGAPLAKFIVKFGKMYRFRVIAAGSVFPFEISVDDHVMSIVASDGFDLEPHEADYFIIQPGERFDFIISANKSIGNYWIRGKTLEINKNHVFEAILRYEGASDEEPKTNQRNCTQANSCTVINCPFTYYPEEDYKTCVLLSELNSLENHMVPAIEAGKWAEHFLNFAFPGEPGNTPSSINGRVFKEPSVNPLFQPNDISTLCDSKNCGVDKVCRCTYSLNLRQNDTVQMILTDLGKGKGYSHPIHMHGHSFYLLKMGYPTYNQTTGYIISDTTDIDCRGDPKKNYCNDAAWSNSNWGGDNIPGLKLKKPLRKDTIIIPTGGYVVIRIKANNPGMWFMHCHVESHSLAGMAIIINESFTEIPPMPKNFPECRNFKGKADANLPQTVSTVPPVTREAKICSDRMTERIVLGVLIAVVCVLAILLCVLVIALVIVLRRYVVKAQGNNRSGVTNEGYANKD